MSSRKRKIKASDPLDTLLTTSSAFPSYQEAKLNTSKRRKKENNVGHVTSVSEVTNFYDILPQEYHTKNTEYENYEQLKINVPFQMLICGPTGSGKTNVMLDIIKKVNCFDKITLMAKELTEPLYRWFIDRIQKVEKSTGLSILTYSEDIAKLPLLDDLKKENTNLLLIDDMITEKSKLLSRVTEYYIRGRKKNCSEVFLSQSYFKTPIDIRKNCGYIILKEIRQMSDLKRILTEYQLNITFEALEDLYTQAIGGNQFNFFMIDLVTKDDNLRFRQNYTGIPASQWKKTRSAEPHLSEL